MFIRARNWTINIVNKFVIELEPDVVWIILKEIIKIKAVLERNRKFRIGSKKWANENGVSFKREGVGNILLTREAVPGFEDFPTLILQTHQDMVSEKTAEPPKLRYRSYSHRGRRKYFVAVDGTTLDADNGIDLVIALSMLIDPSLKKHVKIEVLLIVEE